MNIKQAIEFLESKIYTRLEEIPFSERKDNLKYNEIINLLQQSKKYRQKNIDKFKKIIKLKKYIKITYPVIGEIYYSKYWNLGYINALKDNKIINKKELKDLNNYNNELYLEEEESIKNRLKEIDADNSRIKKETFFGDNIRDTIKIIKRNK